MSSGRVVVVAKRTAYRRFVEEERDPRAKELLRRRDPSVSRWLDSHKEHTRTVDAVHRTLERAGLKVLMVERAHAMFDASDADLVVAVGGDGTTVNAAHYRLSDEGRPFAAILAATYRATYDLADLDRSRFVAPTGQSGNPLSPRYRDFLKLWARGEYVPMTTRRELIEAGALGRLRLTPVR